MKTQIGWALCGIFVCTVFANIITRDVDATKYPGKAQFNGAILVSALAWIGLYLLLF